MTRLPLTAIAFDAGTQIRAAIDEQAVNDYADRMHAGDTFPPLVLFHDGNQHYLADGFHRFMAAQRIGAEDFVVDVRPGTKMVYDRAGGGNTGEVVVGQVIRTIKNAFEGDPAAFDASLIGGLGLTFNRYNGRTNEKDLAAHLAATAGGVRGVLRRAESLRERTGNQKGQCVAATIVDIYNRGVRPKDRLPSWWKEAE